LCFDYGLAHADTLGSGPLAGRPTMERGGWQDRRGRGRNESGGHGAGCGGPGGDVWGIDDGRPSASSLQLCREDHHPQTGNPSPSDFADGYPADGSFSPSGPPSTARFGWPDLTAYRPGVQAPPEERGLPGLRGTPAAYRPERGRPSGLLTSAYRPHITGRWHGSG